MPDKTHQDPNEQLAVAPSIAAKIINSTSSSLEKDRCVGHLGIPYVKAGKKVIYCLSDLKTWLETHKVYPSNIQSSAGKTVNDIPKQTTNSANLKTISAGKAVTIGKDIK